MSGQSWRDIKSGRTENQRATRRSWRARRHPSGTLSDTPHDHQQGNPLSPGACEPVYASRRTSRYAANAPSTTVYPQNTAKPAQGDSDDESGRIPMIALPALKGR